MDKTILFRDIFLDNDAKEEMKIANRFFRLTQNRSLIHNSLVIGRYSVLPYYLELTVDLKANGSKLINSYLQHKYIANLEWYEDIKDYTFPTYFDDNFYRAPEGRYIVKGKTNSRKIRWSTQMYAESKRRALEIASELASDSLIGPQGVAYREYVPLLQIGNNFAGGIPMSNEWRFFFYKNKMLTYGPYWSMGDVTTEPIIDNYGMGLAQEVANIVSEKTNFFVIDIAQKVDKKWIVVEINDAQMSGLSECCPMTLYSNLYKALEEEDNVE